MIHTKEPWRYCSVIDQVEAFEESGNRSLQVKISCMEVEKEANANLIAAAPKMLKVLDALRTELIGDYGKEYFDREWPEINEAINKARGE